MVFKKKPTKVPVLEAWPWLLMLLWEVTESLGGEALTSGSSPMAACFSYFVPVCTPLSSPGFHMFPGSVVYQTSLRLKAMDPAGLRI